MTPRTVLLVDDDPLLQRLLSKRLERRGWIVRTADDGEQALEAARAERPDLVLSDVMMPGIDGVEVARVLTSGPNPPPVVLMSGLASDHMAARAAAAGAHTLLRKPLTSEDLDEVERLVAPAG